jgi:hypothetical protein
LLTKEAQIKREKTKEDLRPFLTISGTSQRAYMPVNGAEPRILVAKIAKAHHENPARAQITH